MRVFFRDGSSNGEWTEGQLAMENSCRTLVISRQTSDGWLTPYKLSHFELHVMSESLSFYGYEPKPTPPGVISTHEYVMRGVEVRFSKPRESKQKCEDTKKQS